MKKLFVLLIILGILGMVFLLPWSAAEVQANDSMRTNERKYFTSYIVERDDTLWDIAGRYMTPEYDSIESYIEEVMESNHLHNDRIREGQMLILPYYSDGPATDTFLAYRTL